MENNNCSCKECEKNEKGQCKQYGDILVTRIPVNKYEHCVVFCDYRNEPDLRAAYDDGYKDGYNDAY